MSNDPLLLDCPRLAHPEAPSVEKNGSKAALFVAVPRDNPRPTTRRSFSVRGPLRLCAQREGAQERGNQF
jgi:hypothetical protein